jgi:hypothetical protein
MAQCEKIKKNGEQCGRVATPGYRFCKIHGGNRKAGIARYELKNGRYSKYLPENIQANYEELLSDPELLDLSHEIALMQTLFGELVQEIQSGGSRANWKELQNMWGEFLVAVEMEDIEEQTDLVNRINDAFERSDKNNTGLKQIQDMSDTLRKLSKDEQMRRVQNQTMIGVEQVMVLLVAALSSLKEAAFLYAEPAVAEKIIEYAESNHRRLIGSGKDTGKPS